MNRHLTRGIAGLAVAAALGGCVVAPRAEHRAPPSTTAAPLTTQAPMYFYPQRQQDAALQERDRYDCYRWAVDRSGFDPGMTPLVVPTAQAPRPVPRDGAEVAAGALTGAVVGAAVSSPRRGGGGSATVIGALFGAALGAIAQESRAQAIEQSQAARSQADQAAQQRAMAPLADFRRAMGACMTGRGYSVG